MTDKMKKCFTPHVIMHSVVGLGIGLVIASLLPGLPLLWIGLGVIVVGTVLDVMQK